MVERTWTYPRYVALHEMWEEEGPPVATWAAAYFKFKGKKPKSKGPPKGAAQHLADLMSELGGSAG